MSVDLRISSQILSSLAKRHGLVFVDAVDLSALERSRSDHVEHLRHWQDSGYAGEMAYMQRDPTLFSDLARFLPGYKSLVVLLIPYARGASTQSLPLPLGHGRVARYAWGRDYHRIIPKKLKSFVQGVREHLGASDSLCCRTFTDAVPLLERAMASHTGLGFIGKNTMFIRAGFGSYGFLAEVLWNVEVAQNEQPEHKAHCGSCSRCLQACPTQAFVAEKVLDARRCISYLTIEKRGAFDEWQRGALGEWIFGCDVCQEVCPFNHREREQEVFPEFFDSQGAGQSLDLAEVFCIRSVEAFQAKFAGTPLMRAKREGLLRNAAAVAANTKAHSCIQSMIRAVEEDESCLVRGEIEVALKRLQKSADGLDSRRLHAFFKARNHATPGSEH